ncbi:hypothetical protein R3P38DRAFT_3363457 [Favolaschia claudopus]|uniref:Uncharacterized protein n=1 Tax=Favolaschia claudopus TaxID=2862362 RepID=A0AAW0AJA6_9AGAR
MLEHNVSVGERDALKLQTLLGAQPYLIATENLALYRRSHCCKLSVPKELDQLLPSTLILPSPPHPRKLTGKILVGAFKRVVARSTREGSRSSGDCRAAIVACDFLGVPEGMGFQSSLWEETIRALSKVEARVEEIVKAHLELQLKKLAIPEAASTRGHK